MTFLSDAFLPRNRGIPKREDSPAALFRRAVERIRRPFDDIFRVKGFGHHAAA